MADALEGQVAMAFAVPRDAARVATPELARTLLAQIRGAVEAG